MARDLEATMKEAKEKLECDICKGTFLKEDVFLIGIQDPVNNSVALLRVCRIDFVMHTTLTLRIILDKHWYAS